MTKYLSLGLGLLVAGFSQSLAAQTPDYPADYETARQTFRELCRQSGGECGVYNLPSSPDLSVDTLWLPAADSKRIFVLISGTHGIETYASSLVQTTFMREQMAQFHKAGINLLLVHAFNPWGFKNNRRVTANNVDMNRNCPTPSSQAYVINQGYQKIKHLLEPEQVTGIGTWPLTVFAAKILWRIVSFQFTPQEMNQAVAGGQREEPRGLFYGGLQPEEQIPWLGTFLDEKFANKTQAVVFDLHTGLGNNQEVHLIADDPPALAQSLREKLFGQGNTDLYSQVSGKTRGFYFSVGDMTDFVEERGPAGMQIVAQTMEFGTKSTSIPKQLQTLFILAAENSAAHTTWPKDQAEQAHKDFKQLFAPAEEAWRQNLLKKSKLIFTQVLERWDTP